MNKPMQIKRNVIFNNWSAGAIRVYLEEVEKSEL